MLLNPIIPILFGLFGLLCAFVVYLQVRSANEGTGKVKEIGDEIHLGAMVFMASEYKELMANLDETGEYSDDVLASVIEALEKFKSTQTW